jgi:Pectate lyase superfamily protein
MADPCCGVNIKDFGAVGDGFTDDVGSVQSAITSAASSITPVICIPSGRYRLTKAIRCELDNLTLLGMGGVLVSDPSDDEAFPEAILVNKNDTSPPAQVDHVTIRDLIIEVKWGSNIDSFSNGVIQLNNCANCVVKCVRIRYTGPCPKPKNLDGIVTGLGTSGIIQDCIVEGIPKVGIYVAEGTHDLGVYGCEIANTSGPIGAAGIGLSGSDRIIINSCISHDNKGDGLLIGVNGLIGDAAPKPATNIQVVGGIYHCNGNSGIAVASGFDDARPTNIQLLGNSVLGNNGRGINIEAGWDVLISNSTTGDNGNSGIWLENLPVDEAKVRTTRVQITDPCVQ